MSDKENATPEEENLISNGATDKKYCIRCGERLTAYERQFYGGCCTACHNVWEKIEKE